MILRLYFIFFIVQSLGLLVNAQSNREFILDEETRELSFQEYTIERIRFIGTLDVNQYKVQHILDEVGIKVGMELHVDSFDLNKANRAILDFDFITSANIYVHKVEANNVFLTIDLKTVPMLHTIRYRNIKREDIAAFMITLRINRNQYLTPLFMQRIENELLKHFKNKGYFFVDVYIEKSKRNDLNNFSDILISIEKGKLTQLSSLKFEGNNYLSSNQLKKVMKHTKEWKWWRFYSKFKMEKYEEDKNKIIEYYHEKGFLEAKIKKDKIQLRDQKNAELVIYIEEGQMSKYFN